MTAKIDTVAEGLFTAFSEVRTGLISTDQGRALASIASALCRTQELKLKVMGSNLPNQVVARDLPMLASADRSTPNT